MIQRNQKCTTKRLTCQNEKALTDQTLFLSILKLLSDGDILQDGDDDNAHDGQVFSPACDIHDQILLLP